MEENLKDLQKYISFANKSENFSYNSDWQWHKELATEIENLIKGYKELEEMLKNRIKYTNELEKDLFENCNNYVISKSKVREKIEELEKEIKPQQEDFKRFGIQICGLHEKEILIQGYKQLLQEGDTNETKM